MELMKKRGNYISLVLRMSLTGGELVHSTELALTTILSEVTKLKDKAINFMLLINVEPIYNNILQLMIFHYTGFIEPCIHGKYISANLFLLLTFD